MIFMQLGLVMVTTVLVSDENMYLYETKVSMFFPHQLGRGSELKHFSLLLTEWEESESIGKREKCDHKSKTIFCACFVLCFCQNSLCGHSINVNQHCFLSKTIL